MTKTSSGTGAVSRIVKALLALVPLEVAAEANKPADPLSDVSEVAMRVKDLTGEYVTGGLLYRVVDGRRKHVANVNESGKPDRKVQCSPVDEFEAQAESPIDRAVDPIRLPCRTKLAFNFRRSLQAVNLPEFSNQYLHAYAGPSSAIYTKYSAQLFAEGEVAAARSLQEAAVAAAAVRLGDAKMESYVGRDPSQGFKLVFTPAGVEALKSAQMAAGIPTTGKLDRPTQDLFSRHATQEQKTGHSLPPLHCSSSRDGFLTCDRNPTPEQEEANVKRFVLPAVPVPAYAVPSDKPSPLPTQLQGNQPR
ncbi:MAG TPA: hypothetical protein VFY73_01795 [Ideonella sp.]|uniref:hypothetical protein n=1 Tax=Ideonella sp. TaxID=1929293 RepID=UPI002E30AAEB|nr:hypothetical protein [Ideonella sp.]HEX5682742.1 hypothetical protein [Ideonella sp.]